MNKPAKKKTSGVERSKRSSPDSIVQRITLSVKDSALVESLYDEFSSLLSPYEVEFRKRQALLIAYELKRRGAAHSEMTDLADVFVGTEAFSHCVKYRHPPTPDDVASVYEEHFRGESVTKSEEDYRKFRERRMKRHLKDGSDERESSKE